MFPSSVGFVCSLLSMPAAAACSKLMTNTIFLEMKRREISFYILIESHNAWIKTKVSYSNFSTAQSPLHPICTKIPFQASIPQEVGISGVIIPFWKETKNKKMQFSASVPFLRDENPNRRLPQMEMRTREIFNHNWREITQDTHGMNATPAPSSTWRVLNLKK